MLDNYPDPPEIEEPPTAIHCFNCKRLIPYSQFEASENLSIECVCGATITEPTSELCWWADDLSDLLLSLFPGLDIDKSTKDLVFSGYINGSPVTIDIKSEYFSNQIWEASKRNISSSNPSKNSIINISIDELKAQWLNDPSWDIENTKGFEKHRIELLDFRRNQEAKWKAESDKSTDQQFMLEESVERIKSYSFALFEAEPHASRDSLLISATLLTIAEQLCKSIDRNGYNSAGEY